MSIFSFTSCKKLVEPSPPIANLSELDVFTNNSTAIAALNGLYVNMQSAFSGPTSISILSGLSADELNLVVNASTELVGHYTNALNSGRENQLLAGVTIWNNLYPLIYDCNSVIEGLSISDQLLPEVKKQLTGEAKFLRGMFYFYLANFYGKVPLVTNRDYERNRVLSRSSIDSVYQQIIRDLSQARDSLSDHFVAADAKSASIERVRPTKAAATALLASVYLYRNDYTSSDAAATQVIANPDFALTSLDSTFLKNSSEAIWQLQPTSDYLETLDGFTFVLTESGPNPYGNPVFLSDTLLNSFETADMRRSHWVASVNAGGIGYFFPYKYKQVTYAGQEYQMVLRLAEQYLIRAEARAYTSDLSGALDDVNAVRRRAGLGDLIGLDQQQILDAIMQERKVELFTELGQRWLDLKRTNMVDAVMGGITPLKGGTWEPTDALFPIPYTDISRDPNLDQNEGYN